MSLSMGSTEDSYRSSTYNKDVHIEERRGDYYIADSAGNPVGSLNGYMSPDRSFVEQQLRKNY